MASKEDYKSEGIFGEITKNLRSVWTPRVVDKNRDTINDELKIRQLFNDLGLYPSKSQVYEMIHCAREGGDSCDFLTFGEFCIFATELKKQYESHQAVTTNVIDADKSIADKTNNESSNSGAKKSSGCSYDVFLGGSCNPTTWRRDIAIPYFKSQDITFYNPQQSNWVPEMIELEHNAKQTSQLLFFVANEKTRNVVSMIEISYLAGKKRKLICCLGKYPEYHHKINNEPLSCMERQDLQAGLTVVNDLVERQGIPVFDNIDTALECATKSIKNNVQLEDLSLKDGAKPVRYADLQIGERIVRLREAFDAVDTTKCGSLSLNDLKMAFRSYVHKDLSSNDIKKISSHNHFNFNDFCCIVTEFKFKKKHNHSTSTANELTTTTTTTTTTNTTTNHNNPEEKSKWRKVKKFFSRVFHKSTTLSSSSAATTMPNSGANNQSNVVQSAMEQQQQPPPPPVEVEEEPCVVRDGAISFLKGRRGSSVRDVYLGGSANGSSWRQDVAVPMLKKHGLTYFNPQAVTRRLMPMWASAIDNSRILLFVIQGNSRSVGAMNEAAFHIGKGHRVVLVIQDVQPDEPVIGDMFAQNESDGEVLTKTALKDYNRGRKYLSDFANREGVPVLDNITEALQCVVEKCKEQS